MAGIYHINQTMFRICIERMVPSFNYAYELIRNNSATLHKRITELRDFSYQEHLTMLNLETVE